VIPLFERQIMAGGPVTVTHPEMKRYFMTIPEAAGLILEAGALGDRDAIYVLDMGEEIGIRDLAEHLIVLNGLSVDSDIEIVYTGIRPGEKLRETLALDFESAHPTPHPKIRILRDRSGSCRRDFSLARIVAELEDLVVAGDSLALRTAVLNWVARLDASSGGAYDETTVPHDIAIASEGRATAIESVPFFTAEMGGS
jgi:FlaA1/EpsC-like NDP-sugar epimerase